MVLLRPADPPRQASVRGIIANKLFAEYGLNQNQTLYVALSGGLDSTVLLHALINIEEINKARVTVLHANHGLHAQAEAWQRQCAELCKAWNVNYLSTHLRIPETSGSGVEAGARVARYHWFESVLTDAGILVTAHHLDDQVETILANLFRGAGVHGLMGIPETRKLGPGQLWRPLLAIERTTLYDYARAHGLEWLEDPANEDTRFTRNHLRHQVIPVVKKAWPGVTKTIVRASDNCRDAAALLDDVAASDLKQINHHTRGHYFVASAKQFNALNRRRCLNALRYWFKQCGFDAPSRCHLEGVFDSMVSAQPRPTAVLTWPGAEMRRYRDCLYLSSPTTTQSITAIDLDKSLSAPVPFGNRRLAVIPAVGRGIKRHIYHSNPISIRTRVGGERCRPVGHRHRRKLKKLMQEEGIPPWERERVPLLYVGDSLAAVIGCCYCRPYGAEAGEPGMLFELID